MGERNRKGEWMMKLAGAQPLIALYDVSKIYNQGEQEVRALDGVNLSIQPGEFVAIVGQSGSGKSTLMNCIGCLDTPTAGRYVFDGIDVSTLSDDALSRIRNREVGFVFQGFNLVASLDAIENVELPLIYRGIPRAERRRAATEALEMVGLGHRKRHRPNMLSGGQQQRVAIARAIAAKPSLILADEPTGNLDSKSGDEVMRILREQNREGRTVILVTHDSAIAASAGRSIRIHDGQIVCDQTPCAIA